MPDLAERLMARHAAEATLLCSRAFYASAALRIKKRCRHWLAKSRPSGHITGNKPEVTVGSSQRRAIQNYRSRLDERGLARFEVLGRDADRDLIPSLARRLAENTPEPSELRVAVSKSIANEPPKPGGILAALRRSPLVGADLDLSRPHEEGRKADL